MMAPSGVPVVDDAQAGQIASKLNALRAGVMGANDGIQRKITHVERRYSTG